MTIMSMNPDFTSAYVQQWNINVQRELWRKFVLTVAYLGNKGTHLQTLQGFNLNQLAPQYLALGNALNQQVPNPFSGLVASGPLSTATAALIAVKFLRGWMTPTNRTYGPPARSRPPPRPGPKSSWSTPWWIA